MERAPRATGVDGTAAGTPGAFVTRNQRLTPIQTGGRFSLTGSPRKTPTSRMSPFLSRIGVRNRPRSSCWPIPDRLIDCFLRARAYAG